LSDDLPDDQKIALSEWQTARDTMKAFDDRTHDLWKYGFGFITALLAAQSLLIPSLTSGGTSGGVINTSAIPDVAKLGVLVVTLALVVLLRQVEKVYSLYKSATNTRALILERKLNIELSGTITSRYSRYHISRRINMFYFGFAFADAFLGTFILQSTLNIIILWVSAVVAVGFVYGIGRSKPYYRRGEESDWTYDQMNPMKGDLVKITLTNLSEKDSIDIAEKDLLYSIRLAVKASDNSQSTNIERVTSKNEVRIGPLDDYSWFWDTAQAEPGIYLVYPTVENKFVQRLQLSKENLEKMAEWSGVKFSDEDLKQMAVRIPSKWRFWQKQMESQSWAKLKRWILPFPLVGKLTVSDKKEEAEEDLGLLE